MMTLEEEGAYCRLLWSCWQHGSIPSDPELAARLVGKGCSATVARVVLPMFEVPCGEGRLTHDRLEREREKQAEWRKKSSEGGKKSAEMRSISKGGSRVVQAPYQPKGNIPVSVLQSPIPVRTNINGESSIEEVGQLIEQLGFTIYNRNEGQHPTYDEEHAALEITKRPDWQSEKDQILAFGRIIDPKDRRFDMPKTLLKLLTNWSSALDSARNYKPHANSQTSKPNPRNIGVCRAGPSYGEAAKLKQQRQSERMGNQVAQDSNQKPPEVAGT